jgi:hypothetical protein
MAPFSCSLAWLFYLTSKSTKRKHLIFEMQVLISYICLIFMINLLIITVDLIWYIKHLYIIFKTLKVAFSFSDSYLVKEYQIRLSINIIIHFCSHFSKFNYFMINLIRWFKHIVLIKLTLINKTTANVQKNSETNKI